MASHDDRRSARAKFSAALRHPKRHSPEFLALEVVANETERTEIADNMTPVSRRRRRGGTAVRPMMFFQCLGFDPTRPPHASVRGIMAPNFEQTIIEGGEENALPPNSRGRWRPRHVDVPG